MVVQHLQGRVLEDNAPRSEHEEEVEAKRPAADAAAFGDRDGDGGADELVSHTDAEDDLVKNCNYLLAQVGLNVKNVESYKELTRAAPSLLVAVYEALFQERLVGVVRSPRTIANYAQNAQCVIDGLSKQIQMGLQHISGEAIALGERRALTNIVDILRRIVSITRGPRLRGSKNSPGASSEEEADIASGSLSTRESFYEVSGLSSSQTQRASRATAVKSAARPKRKGLNSRRGRGLAMMPPCLSSLRRKTAKSVSSKSLVGIASSKRRIPSNTETWAPQSSLDSTLDNVRKASAARVTARFAIDKRLNAAKQRRQQVKSFREARAASLNQFQRLRAQQIFEKKAREDSAKTSSSYEMRRSNEQLVLQRQIYQTAVHKLNEIKLSEYAETKEKLRKMKEDADIHLQSMHKLFEDKIDMLNEKERTESEVALANAENRRVAKRACDAEVVSKQREALKKKQEILSQRWERELHKLRDAQESFLRAIRLSGAPVENLIMSACRDKDGAEPLVNISSIARSDDAYGSFRADCKNRYVVNRRVNQLSPAPRARMAAWR